MPPKKGGTPEDAPPVSPTGNVEPLPAGQPRGSDWGYLLERGEPDPRYLNGRSLGRLLRRQAADPMCSFARLNKLAQGQRQATFLSVLPQGKIMARCRNPVGPAKIGHVSARLADGLSKLISVRPEVEDFMDRFHTPTVNRQNADPSSRQHADCARYALAANPQKGECRGARMSKINDVEVGRRLQALRKVLNLTQAEIADANGIDRTNWGRFEKGKRLLPRDIAFDLAERYGITIDWLYRGRVDGLSIDMAERLRQAM